MKNHFNFSPTPLTKLVPWSNEFDCNVFMKREDLFEHGGGGSKARMLQYILWDAKQKKADYILTAGGPYSNFNRALALLCKKHQFRMRLVLYDKNTHIGKYSLNKRIIDYCNVDVITCPPDYVIETIDHEKKKLIDSGFVPYYIWGGGKSNEGVNAYLDAFKEIKSTLNHVDYIFTALGTGTTYSGLLAGSISEKKATKIIGISIARKKDIAENVVKEIFQNFSRDISSYLSNGMIIDDYLMGGYGNTTNELDKFILEFVQKEGLIIDSIYVGKALYGMYHYLKKNSTQMKGRTIVFINTGGLFNF